jgi:NAD(P)-dependent dehydrogenase (short-subunit alcohol dehydrogenase family)
VELVGHVIEERQKLAKPPKDLLGILLSLKDGDTPRYSTSVITGILVSTMFAGHHTSAGTAAWTLVELLRGPGQMKRVVEELDHIYADRREVSHQALREIPHFENAVKEALRLHPPLIWLPRTTLVDFPYEDFVVPKGAIVNQSSTAAWMSAGYYGLAKLAMNGLTGALAKELGGRKIRVNAIAPGPTDTEALRTVVPEAFKKQLVASLALPRLGTPDDLVPTCLFLLSDAAAWITGQVINVDGGQIMRP